MKEDNIGIYIHIPFCVSKCNYCSFVSKNASKEEIEKYIDFLCLEIELKADEYKERSVSSIYFGGGTPSFIDPKLIQKVLETIKRNFIVLSNVEISIECNPCSTTREKLEIYKEIGINRISFGVQTMNDELLKLIGRKHTQAMAINAIVTAKEVGFTNISCDLMIGIPNQTKEDLICSFESLEMLGIMHISAYMLMLEEGTILSDKVNSGQLSIASDDECVDMYNELVKRLEKSGFYRYEISNFSKKGYECKHNINYWDMGEYVGFGVASHSFVGGIRFANFNNFDKYYRAVEILKNKQNYLKFNKNIEKKDDFELKNTYSSYELLDNTQIIEEIIMLGLRQEKGVSLEKLQNYGCALLNKKEKVIGSLKEKNIIKVENGHVKLCPEFYGVCNAVVLELID